MTASCQRSLFFIANTIFHQRSTCLRLDGEYSRFFMSSRGTRQGQYHAGWCEIIKKQPVLLIIFTRILY